MNSVTHRMPLKVIFDRLTASAPYSSSIVADIVARRGAEFERLHAVAEQLDVVDGLRALLAAVEHAGAETVGDLAQTCALGRRLVFVIAPEIIPHD